VGGRGCTEGLCHGFAPIIALPKLRTAGWRTSASALRKRPCAEDIDQTPMGMIGLVDEEEAITRHRDVGRLHQPCVVELASDERIADHEDALLRDSGLDAVQLLTERQLVAR